MEENSNLHKQVKSIYSLLFTFLALFVLVGIGLVYLINNPDAFSADKPVLEKEYVAVPEEDYDKIENGIHLRTGFIDGEGLMETVNNCTNCHSSKLVIQNRMSKERWIATIRWMQKTQNLWDLGKNEEIIVDYLVKNYPVEKKGRRGALTNVEWYDLQN